MLPAQDTVVIKMCDQSGDAVLFSGESSTNWTLKYPTRAGMVDYPRFAGVNVCKHCVQLFQSTQSDLKDVRTTLNARTCVCQILQDYGFARKNALSVDVIRVTPELEISRSGDTEEVSAASQSIECFRHWHSRFGEQKEFRAAITERTIASHGLELKDITNLLCAFCLGSIDPKPCLTDLATDAIAAALDQTQKAGALELLNATLFRLMLWLYAEKGAVLERFVGLLNRHTPLSFVLEKHGGKSASALLVIDQLQPMVAEDFYDTVIAPIHSTFMSTLSPEYVSMCHQAQQSFWSDPIKAMAEKN